MTPLSQFLIAISVAAALAIIARGFYVTLCYANGNGFVGVVLFVFLLIIFFPFMVVVLFFAGLFGRLPKRQREADRSEPYL